MSNVSSATNLPPRTKQRAAVTFCVIASVLFAALFTDVIIWYWAFIGVDTPGAGCAVIGLYAPGALVVFLGTALVVFFGSRRYLGPWPSVGLSVLAVAAVLLIAFSLEVHRMSDYPRDQPVTTAGFLKFYVQRLIGVAPRRPN